MIKFFKNLIKPFNYSIDCVPLNVLFGHQEHIDELIKYINLFNLTHIYDSACAANTLSLPLDYFWVEAHLSLTADWVWMRLTYPDGSVILTVLEHNEYVVTGLDEVFI